MLSTSSSLALRALLKAAAARGGLTHGPARLTGLTPAALAWHAAARAQDGPQFVVVPTDADVEQMAADARFFFAAINGLSDIDVERQVLPFPSQEVDPYRGLAPHLEIASARARLERLCRYALRPAVGQDRLQAMPDGTVVLELRRRWRDRTTHVIFEPVELLERIAALVPRPRVNLVLYHGVFAPRAKWRPLIVPSPPEATTARATASEQGPAEPSSGRHPRPANRTWAELMQRSFGFDVLACPRCGRRLRLVALIQSPAVITRTPRHLQLPEERPTMRPSRDPPLPPREMDDGAVFAE